MADDQITLIALDETTNFVPKKPERKKRKQEKESHHEVILEVPEDREESDVKSVKGERQASSLKQRLQRLPRLDLSKLLRTDVSRLHRRFSRLRGGLGHVNCFRVEEEDSPFVEPAEMERHRSVDLGIRRSSLSFFRRKQSFCHHPYHPYTPKQFTRLVWNVHHFKS